MCNVIPFSLLSITICEVCNLNYRLMRMFVSNQNFQIMACVLAELHWIWLDFGQQQLKFMVLIQECVKIWCCYPGEIIQWKCPDRWMNVWKWKCENWLNRMLLNYEMINNTQPFAFIVVQNLGKYTFHHRKKHSTHPTTTTQKKRTQELFYYTRFVHKVEPNDRSFVSSYK